MARKAPCLLGVLVLLSLGNPLYLAQGETPPHPPRSALTSPYETAEAILPADWKERFPFSQRFVSTAEKSGDLHIQLVTTDFTTSNLVSGTSPNRSYLHPDASTFPPQLLFRPFARAEQELFLVQAEDPATLITLRQHLQRLGLEILEYIPQQAYLVRLNAAQKAIVERLPSVYWVGFYQPAWKVDPALDFLIETAPRTPLEMVVEVGKDLYPTARSVVDLLDPLPIAIFDVLPSGNSWWVECAGAVGHARSIAALVGVRGILPNPEASLAADIARSSASIPTGRGAVPGPVMDVEDVWTRGIRGEGEIVAVYDGGLSTGDLTTLHRDFGRQGDSNNPPRVISGYAPFQSTTDDWADSGQVNGGGHGTHVAGLLGGNGVESGSQPHLNIYPSTSFTGIAPKVQFVIQSGVDDTNSFVTPAVVDTILQTAYDDGARVHSNSWRAPARSRYDSLAQSADRFLHQHQDLVMVAGVGNEGPDANRDGVVDPELIGSPAVGKNVIAVGATETYRPDFIYGRLSGSTPAEDCSYIDEFEKRTWGWTPFPVYTADPLLSDLLADNLNGMVPFSNRGPTTDERFKPDLVAPGGFITSTRTNFEPNPGEFSANCDLIGLEDHYISKEGTSMATPLVSGAAVLTRQYYRMGWHADGSKETNASPIPSQGFNPSAALVRATLVNGAWDMTPGQYGTGATQEIPPNWDTGNDLPNNASGYGRVDLEATLFPGSGFGHDPDRKMQIFDVEQGLTTDADDSYTFPVGNGALSGPDPLTFTLVWTDPAASTSSAFALVNDLDLEVTAPNGTRYYPNGLDRTTGTADRRNNVEQVRVTAPQNGAWSVRVTGWNVPGNGDPGSTSQPYALVVSGVLLDNSPPDAMDDFLSASENTPRSVIFNTDLLPNDSDPDGDTLSVASTTEPLHGTLFGSGVVGLLYTPNPDYSGPDSFTYTVTDGSLTDTATVFITVNPVNDPPDAVDDFLSTPEDTPRSIIFNTDLLPNDSDPDGDSLSVASWTQPLHGTLTGSGVVGLTYSPDTDYSGPDSFTYTVTDGSLTDTATVFITVDPVNDPPVALDDTFIVAEDTDLALSRAQDLLINDSDPEGDSLAIVAFGPASNGTVIPSPGQVTYRPNPNFFGIDSFTYTVTDGSLTDTATVFITVNPVNDPPDAMDDAFVVGQDTDLVLSRAQDLLINDTDIDGDTLAITAFGSAQNGVVIPSPGQVTYRPNPGFVGSDSFTYTASDGDLTDTATVSVQVLDTQAPVAVITDPPTCQLTTCTFDGSQSADNVSIVSYIWTFGDGSGGNGAIVPHTYSPPGTFTVTLTVTDTAGNQDTAELTFTPDEPPTAAFTFQCDNLTCSFDAATSADDQGIASYAWTFGDATGGQGISTNHGYFQDGFYAVTLIVTDGSGQTDSLTQMVRVVDEESVLKLILLCDT